MKFEAVDDAAEQDALHRLVGEVAVDIVRLQSRMVVEVFSKNQQNGVDSEDESFAADVGDGGATHAVPFLDTSPMPNSASFDGLDQKALREGQQRHSIGAGGAHRCQGSSVDESMCSSMRSCGNLVCMVLGHESSNPCVHQPRALLHRSEVMDTACNKN